MEQSELSGEKDTGKGNRMKDKQTTFLSWDGKQKRLVQFTKINVSYFGDENEDENIFGQGELNNSP